MEIKEVNPRLNSATGGFAYSATTITYFIASLIISVIILLAKVEQWSAAHIYLLFLGSPLGIAAGIAATLGLRKVKFKEICPLKCRPKYYLIGVMIAFGLFFSLNRINELILGLFNLEASEQSIKISEFILGLKGAQVLPALLVIALLPACFEELFFRGAILQSTQNSMGSVRAILVVGFAFSLFHGSPEQTVYQFIAGCLFAFVAVRSGSLLPSVLMHFLNNAFVIILGVCLGVDESGNFNMPFGVNIALIVIGALCLVGGVVWLILDKTELKKPQPGGVKSFFLFASLGIFIMTVTWIITLIGVVT